ncbi:AVN_HP_G0119680.mRNA.1.CDS.1 [Saccharomyces cerevisiae]|nr:AVN_HP_G0119680.mRNA.1.CDS.1 [Saccharomyces cerevisiae]CAI6996809.1 AVN_HP_G0119680.mRNA.1.CDS.1 [Saccharomyces cerevisiae]
MPGTRSTTVLSKPTQNSAMHQSTGAVTQTSNETKLELSSTMVNWAVSRFPLRINRQRVRTSEISNYQRSKCSGAFYV